MGSLCNGQLVVWAFIVILQLSSLWFIWNNSFCQIPARYTSTASNINQKPAHYPWITLLDIISDIYHLLYLFVYLQVGYLLPRDPLDTYSEWTCSQCDFYLEVSQMQMSSSCLKASLYQFVWYSFHTHSYGHWLSRSDHSCCHALQLPVYVSWPSPCKVPPPGRILSGETDSHTWHSCSGLPRGSQLLSVFSDYFLIQTRVLLSLLCMIPFHRQMHKAPGWKQKEIFLVS